MVSLWQGSARTWGLRYFAPNGIVLDFNDAGKYMAASREGFGIPDPTIQTTQGLRGDGAVVTSVKSPPRDLFVPVHLFPGRTLTMNELRREINAAMDPFLGDGILEYEDRQTGHIWSLVCRAMPSPMTTAEKGATHQLERFHWRAYDPWWYMPTQETLIPWDGSVQTLHHAGTVPVGWVLTVLGAINNPTFVNDTTGELITIQAFIDPDHYLQITSLQNRKQALAIDRFTGDSQNVFPNRSRGSTYWQLQPGDNDVRLYGSPPPPIQGSVIAAEVYTTSAAPAAIHAGNNQGSLIWAAAVRGV